MKMTKTEKIKIIAIMAGLDEYIKKNTDRDDIGDIVYINHQLERLYEERRKSKTVKTAEGV